MEDFCEESTCSICQEFFKDPVTLECEHNFCQDCLSQCWEKLGTTETSCPQCGGEVLQGDLRPNRPLADFVERTKKLNIQWLRKAESRQSICEKHKKPLNLFCKDDESPTCEVCNTSKEHVDHREIPQGPAAEDYKVDLTASAPEDPMEGEVTCSVCLEDFKDPVTLECGHNFCRSCVTQTWEKSLTQETTCPHCREKVQQRNLKSNRQLANIIEITKKLRQGQKRTEGKERVCEKHQEPLKLFCKDDETPICCVCHISKEHKDHIAIPVEEAAQDYKDFMGNHKAILEKQKEKILVYKAETEKKFQDNLKQSEAEIENTLGEIKEVCRFLEEQGKQLRAQMEELRKQTARERDENLAMFDQELSSLKNLIQELKAKCQQPPAELLQDVKSLLQRSEEKKTFEKPVVFSEELKWKTWELYDLKSSLVPVMKQFPVKPAPLAADTWLPALELPKANVTLDPDTANRWLFLSEDRRSVRFGDEPQMLPDTPERFSNSFCVLGCEEFIRGRHFWEVAVGGEGDWLVGVAKKSVRRKGLSNIYPSESIWAVGRWAGRYYASKLFASSVLSLSEKTRRVRICLNCTANRVTFYDADTGDQIYAFSEIPISGETVLPFFYVLKESHLEITP